MSSVFGTSETAAHKGGKKTTVDEGVYWTELVYRGHPLDHQLTSIFVTVQTSERKQSKEKVNRGNGVKVTKR